MSYIYKEAFRIRTSEIDHNKQIHAHSLIQLMQEASMQHTIGLNVSAWDLEKLSVTWVLIKMEVNFILFPSLGHTLDVQTYPTAMEGYFTYRDYFVYNEASELCATSSSMWAMMDTESRKMVKIPLSYGSLVYQADAYLPRPSEKLIAPKEIDFSNTVVVNYFHLDWNGHVNNVQIIRMIMETLDPSYQFTHQISKFNIQFKSEAILGQELTIIHQIITPTDVRHAIIDKASEKILVIALSTFVIV